METAGEKLASLKEHIRSLESVAVGFSGGVDSSVVMAVAHEVLGSSAVAVIGDSEAFPQGEVDSALQVAQQFGWRVYRSRTHELSNVHFRVNTPDRCYHCKSELFGVLRSVALELGLKHIADGSHADDVHDHRPGMRAADEQMVRSPLLECGITKAEVRQLAHLLGLPNWDKPSFACLSSRFPYGTEITTELLARVDGCERVMRELGFRQFRVRHHGDTARIEVPEADFAQVLQHREEINRRFRQYGYLFATLDLEPYRSGRMNDALKVPGIIRAHDLLGPRGQ